MSQSQKNCSPIRVHGHKSQLVFCENDIQSQYLNKDYSFNVCFEPKSDQQHVFDHSGVRRLTELACEGYSCTCFVFGQTGSGKTFTMTGPPDEFLNRSTLTQSLFGIAPRSFFYLFQLLRCHGNYRVYASYLEIYNEQVNDLLNPHPLYPLNIRWRKKRGFYVDNLFLIECETPEELLEVLQRGMRNRNFKATSPNDFSSRSHCILTVHIDSEVIDSTDDTIIFTKHGKLSFVDLAGSEKVKTDVESSQNQLQETNNINRSLLVLGNCISCLSDSKRRNIHVPFRDSKLTKLLADSLGGNGVTLMIACISPSSSSITDTSNTLRYAARALKIESKPLVKLDPKEKIIVNLKREIFLLRQENIILKTQLLPNYPTKDHRNKEFGTISGSPSKQSTRKSNISTPSMAMESAPTQASLNSNAEETNGNLFEMMQEYMMENENLRRTNQELTQVKERSVREYETLMHENEKLSIELDTIKKPAGMDNKRNDYLSKSTTLISTVKPKQMSPNKSSTTENKRYKRNSYTINLSDFTTADNSYSQLYDSRKKISNSLPTRRSFNNGTRLSPLRNISDLSTVSGSSHYDLLLDNARIEDEIKSEQRRLIKFQRTKEALNDSL